jgi:hypothetical protein
MKKRLVEFLNYLNIGQNKFAKNVGLSGGYFSTIKDNITVETVKKILSVYPELNVRWLLTGEGEMLNNSQHLENVNNSMAIGRDANGSKITIKSQNIDEFIKITEKYQSHIDRLLSIIEKLTEK